MFYDLRSLVSTWLDETLCGAGVPPRGVVVFLHHLARLVSEEGFLHCKASL